MNQVQFWQTGDVLYFREKKIPKGKSIKSGVIIKSQVTGHAHTVKDGELRQADDGVMWIKVEKRASLHHEEHDDITLPKGFYRVAHVQEYSHFDEESRNAID